MVTGTSPLAACKADKVTAQTGKLYRNAEVEPWVAANPADASNLLAGLQQDRWSNGGARGDVAAVSRNGGASWKAVLLPKVTLCGNGTYQRASDPWVDFAPDGTAYFQSLAFDQDRPGGRFGPNAILVSRSIDKGLSWGNPQVLISDTDPQVLNDKNSLTADPKDASHVYAAWDRLRDIVAPSDLKGGPRGARERARVLRQAAAARAQALEPFFEGPSYFARTTDGGTSWEPARPIYDPGPNAQTINNLVAVLPDGTVIVFFTHLLATGETRIELLRSTDKGASFAPSPTAIVTLQTSGTVTPDERAGVRDASILFDVAVDAGTGGLFLVWQDLRFRGVEEVAFSMSTDGGSTWSAPARVSRTPANPNRLRQQAFIPSIEVGPGGVLVVTYYDFRKDTRTGELTDHWAVLCDPRQDDCRQAAGWTAEVRLTSRSFDMLKAPQAGDLFIGDYVGLVRAGNAVHPVFPVVDGKGLTSLVTRKLAFGQAGRLATLD